MKHIRATNSRILDRIKSELIPDSDVPVETYIEQVRTMMIYQPHSIWFAVSFDEDKNDLITGFAIAFAPEGFDYVFISQVWCHNDYRESKLPDHYLMRLKAWVESLGRWKIRMETSRDPRAFTKRWLFKPISTTMELDLTQNYGEELDESEDTDGQVKRSEEREHADRNAEGSNGSIGGVSGSRDNGEVQSEVSGSPGEQQANAGSDTVHGSDNPQPDLGVRHSESDDSGIQSVRTELSDPSGSGASS